MRRMKILKIILGIVGSVAVLAVGILIGHYGVSKKSTSESGPSWLKDVGKDLDESFIEKFLSEVDNMKIQENLR